MKKEHRKRKDRNKILMNNAQTHKGALLSMYF